MNDNSIHLDIKSLKLDLGCGPNKFKAEAHGLQGYVGLDVKDFGQQIVWNLDNGIPLPNGSCEEIFASHVLEHVTDPVLVLNEMHRVLDGEAHVVVPNETARGRCSLVHKHNFNEQTFRMLEPEAKAENWEYRYDVMPWKIRELVVNKKDHIHIWMTPIKQY